MAVQMSQDHLDVTLTGAESQQAAVQTIAMHLLLRKWTNWMHDGIPFGNPDRRDHDTIPNSSDPNMDSVRLQKNWNSVQCY